MILLLGEEGRASDLSLYDIRAPISLFFFHFSKRETICAILPSYSSDLEITFLDLPFIEMSADVDLL